MAYNPGGFMQHHHSTFDKSSNRATTAKSIRKNRLMTAAENAPNTYSMVEISAEYN